MTKCPPFHPFIHSSIHPSIPFAAVLTHSQSLPPSSVCLVVRLKVSVRESHTHSLLHFHHPKPQPNPPLSHYLNLCFHSVPFTAATPLHSYTEGEAPSPASDPTANPSLPWHLQGRSIAIATSNANAAASSSPSAT